MLSKIKQKVKIYFNERDSLKDVILFKRLVTFFAAILMLERVVNYEKYFNVFINTLFLESSKNGSIFLNEAFYLTFHLLGLLIFGLSFVKVKNQQLSIASYIIFLVSTHFFNQGITFGIDSYVLLGFFYLCFVGFKDDSSMLAIKILKIHIVITYFWAGFCKAISVGWLDGESLYGTLNTINFNTKVVEWSQFSDNIWLFSLMSIYIILLEALGCFGLLTRYRVWFSIQFILLHVGIALFMGLPFFALVMISFQVLFIEPIKRQSSFSDAMHPKNMSGT